MLPIKGVKIFFLVFKYGSVTGSSNCFALKQQFTCLTLHLPLLNLPLNPDNIIAMIKFPFEM